MNTEESACRDGSVRTRNEWTAPWWTNVEPGEAYRMLKGEGRTRRCDGFCCCCREGDVMFCGSD